ncbi:lysozyme inhibitor LprI family protein [Pseudomonas sp. SWRI153]|uniref:Lysozyme inhibitor LprI family protein n=1 Tax=Pseudomonas khorasanensis TaxID=2745508 RepID=A0A923F8C6_9PSED|nr:lysozyme inhibitor LprI family protein [Pseudomonas khorasanensis]MBV4488912.1 lysozyme inhibitor LprI family protein [Pseudomonas khorasanensis]
MSPRLLLMFTPFMFSSFADAAVDCANAVDQATMNQCAGEEYKAADKELNSVYQQIVGRLKENPDGKKLLLSAQRAWIGFRDAECKFSASGVAGGSVYPLIYSGCLTSVTKARVEALKQYLKCEEGDMSCPVSGA